MANFNFTVDTNPMADEIHGVSKHVDAVSGSVIAMQTAVVLAEKEGAEHVCNNLNKGFYSLIQSQISQKIAALTSQIEAKLMDMGQQAIALRAIQNRMERDYHMISNRYGKLFNSLNTALYTRIQDLDKAAVLLVHRDQAISESRIKSLVGSVAINQIESIANAQLILASKTKSDGASTIDAIHKYIMDVNLQAKQSEDVITDVAIDDACKIYLPIFITELSNELGSNSTKYYAPKSDIGVIDSVLAQGVQSAAIEAVKNGNWQAVDEGDKHALDSEFSTLVVESELNDRVKKEISKLYNNVESITHLKEVEL